MYSYTYNLHVTIVVNSIVSHGQEDDNTYFKLVTRFSIDSYLLATSMKFYLVVAGHIN